MYRSTSRQSEHRLLFAVIVTLIFVGLSIFALLTHELSRPELLAWEESRTIDLSRADSFRNISSSPLWLILLSLFSQHGLPIITMQIFALGLTALAVFLFTCFAKLRRSQKLLAVGSVAFFYFYATLPSSYSLLPLTLTLLLLAFPGRFRHPVPYALVLALLPQIDFSLSGVALVLAVFFVIRFLITPNARTLARKKALQNVKRREVSVSAATVKRNEDRVKHARSSAAWLFLIVPLLFVSIYFSAQFALHFMKSSGDLQFVDGNFFALLDVNIYGTIAPIFEITGVLVLFVFLLHDLRAFFITLFSVFAMFLSTCFFGLVPAFSGQFFIAILSVETTCIFLSNLDPARPFAWQKRLTKTIDKLQLIDFLKGHCDLKSIILLLPFTLSIPNAIGSFVNDLVDYHSFYGEIAHSINADGNRSVIVVADDITSDLLSYLSPLLESGNDLYDIQNDQLVSAVSHPAAPTAISNDEFKARLAPLLSNYDHVYYFQVQGGCPNASADYAEVADTYVEGSIYSPTDLLVRRADVEYGNLIVYHLKSPN